MTMTGDAQNVPEVKISNGIAILSRGGSQVASFDLEGRLLHYTESGVTYRRSISNRLLRLGWDGDIRIVGELPGNEASEIIGRAYALTSAAASGNLSPEASEFIKTASSRSVQWAQSDGKSAESLYSMFPVLPPDQTGSMYLEITSGCRWNRCTLCRGYESREYTVKEREQFFSHIEDVLKFYGRGLSSRKSIFLGDVSALDIDQKYLLEVLSHLKQKLGLPVYTAFDVFTTPKKKNMINYRDLGENGLDRVYVYLESGSYRVIRLFNKHINITETMNLINNIKDHKIPVSIVVMAGIGGKKFSKDHVEATANIISQLALVKGDTILLSPIMENEDSNYSEITEREQLLPMSIQEKYRQMDELSSAIKEAFKEMNGRDIAIPVVKTDLRETIL